MTGSTEGEAFRAARAARRPIEAVGRSATAVVLPLCSCSHTPRAPGRSTSTPPTLQLRDALTELLALGVQP